MDCKICNTNFHYCTSCGAYNDAMYYGYCSNECYIESDSFKKAASLLDKVRSKLGDEDLRSILENLTYYEMLMYTTYRM